MNKQNILTQIYPDELDYIFDLKRKNELKRYQGYFNQIMAATAVFGGEAAEEYIDNLLDDIKRLNKKETEKEEKHDLDSELDKLRGLNNIINNTKKKKRPPKGVK